MGKDETIEDIKFNVISRQLKKLHSSHSKGMDSITQSLNGMGERVGNIEVSVGRMEENIKSYDRIAKRVDCLDNDIAVLKEKNIGQKQLMDAHQESHGRHIRWFFWAVGAAVGIGGLIIALIEL